MAEEQRNPIEYVEDAPMESGMDRVDGRRVKRKSVTDDKLRNVSSISDNTIVQVMMADNSVGKAELKYEQVSVTITGTNTSGTATVTVNSIPIGYFLSAFTTPAASYVKLSVSSTTLTVELSTAPGAGNSVTIQCVLLKA